MCVILQMQGNRNNNHSQMNRILLSLLLLLTVSAGRSQSLQECIRMAESNYPLIRQYELIRQTTEFTVSNIRKGWLPQVSATAQGTYQSDVTAWPQEMRNTLAATGLNLRGLKKDQYRVGVDIVQTVFDGGSMKAQRNVAELEGEQELARTDVTLFAVRQRVIDMYYSLLLLQTQAQMQENLIGYLRANEAKLESMHRNGTAALSDYHTVRAERLGAEQSLTDLRMKASSCARMLALFCGADSVKPVMDEPGLNGNESGRPELRYIDSQVRLAKARDKLLDTALMPKVSVFATGFYGYPGYNMFDDMMHHKWSLNGMVGLKMTWNIGALYTLKADRAKLRRQVNMAETNRDVFLFNNRLDQMRQQDNMRRYESIKAADDEIISLRTEVRKASESRLNHGIVDVSELVKDLKNEHNAILQKSVHEIEFLKEQAELNYATNGMQP